MKDVQIFGDSYFLVDGEGVTIHNVDPAQVVGEFYHGDLLDAMEYSDVVQWVADKEKERVEEANE